MNKREYAKLKKWTDTLTDEELKKSITMQYDLLGKRNCVVGRIRGEEGMIYNFYTEFANAEEFTKTNRSAEWKDVCDWCLENGIRVGCFPVAIDDKIQAFFFCEVNGDTPSEQEVLERLKMVVPNVHSTSQEIPVAIDWGRIIDGCSHSSKSKDREKGTKVIKPASLVGLGDYELKTTFRRNN